MLDKEFLFELSSRFQGEIGLDKASRILYSTDASIYQIEPLGVLFPKTQDDLLSSVELAVKYKIPIIPRGSGSSLGGQVVGQALILDCSRHLNKLVSLDKESHTAVVEPGVILADLNRQAGKLGLMFGPDPASAERATMGGVVGNNATGAHSILYGMTADHLLSADVILGDGSIETWDTFARSKLAPVAESVRDHYGADIKERFPRSWRNSAGYRLNYLLPWSPSVPPQWDSKNYRMQGSIYKPGNGVNLAQLLAGSEGTLAVARRVTVNLVPKPKLTMLGILAYESVAAACDDVPRLLAYAPSAIELIPRLILRLAKSIPSYARQMGWMFGDPAAVLVVEFSGEDVSQLRQAIRRIGEVLAVAQTSEEQARIWNVRKMGLGILDSQPVEARPAAFIEDCAVPVESLGSFIREVERIMAAHGAEGGIYAHASAGCLHIRPILNLRTTEGVRSLRSIGDQVAWLVLSLGGSMSSEHGDGLVSGEWIEKTYGPALVEAMRSIKKAADPHNLLNPKKMFDAPPMDQNLRFGGKYTSTPWASALRFSHQSGLGGAIEQCNGQGVCRKTTGVMCPSFQATRDEKFSTRGRANLLRAMISGDGRPAAEITDGVFEALDLCLACKGCTSECPSGVDMPKLKSEFMNEYYRGHRRPVRDYLFGYIHNAAGWLALTGKLVPLIEKRKWMKSLIAQFIGIAAERPLPVFRRNPLPEIKLQCKHAQAVCFLPDVFSRYMDPEVERSAVNILDHFGYEVKFLKNIGTGISMLSKGFVESARAHSSAVLDEIMAISTEAPGINIVGVEPPEVYCLKNDYASLQPARMNEIADISNRTWLLDEFLLRVIQNDEMSAANLRKEFMPRPENRKVMFHPHCHQRAEGLAEDGAPSGVSATVELLQRFGFEVAVAESGCCGMAGTFGYEKEHYDLSMQVGELKLFPALRAAQETRVVSSGSACRLQIRHGVNIEAIHPIVLIADLLEGKL